MPVSYQQILMRHRSLENKFTTSGPNLLQQNAAANILKGLQDTHMGTLQDLHPRWWEFALQPPTPSPANVKYECNDMLGRPSVGNCEAALYQFVRSGSVSFDPANGPTIMSSGMFFPRIPLQVSQVSRQ